jgi:hypothetical protein
MPIMRLLRHPVLAAIIVTLTLHYWRIGAMLVTLIHRRLDGGATAPHGLNHLVSARHSAIVLLNTCGSNLGQLLEKALHTLASSSPAPYWQELFPGISSQNLMMLGMLQHLGLIWIVCLAFWCIFYVIVAERSTQ